MTKTKMQTSLVIPALNEEESISQVLSAVPKDVVKEVIVVDGSSSDRTVSLAINGGAVVIQENQRGYGRACSSGLHIAKGEIVVFMDADGADDPSLIPHLISPILEGKADLVLASRLKGKIEFKAMPLHQKIGNQFSAWLIRVLYRIAITDLSPFRAILRDKLLGLEMRDMTFGWPTEMIIKAARNNLRILEIPTKYSPRIGGRSKISGTLRGTLLATYHILATIFRYSVE